MTGWLRKRLPVPMAAPETANLRAGRRRLIAAAGGLGALTLFWSTAARLLAGGAFALFVGLVVFIAVQGVLWARAKTAADDAWLASGEWRDD